MDKAIIKEACVESFSEAYRASQLGANRLELCSDLHNSGTTASFGTAKQCKKKLNIPLNCIIRPRKGNFVYDSNEVDIMINDITHLINYVNVDGIVIGALTKEGHIDIITTKKLIDIAKELNKEISVTFHMAFDEIKDNDVNWKDNIEILIKLGCDRILTKGGKTNAIEGKENIKKYIEYANKRIVIMPGGGVNSDNYKELIEYTGAKEVHGTKIVGLLN